MTLCTDRFENRSIRVVLFERFEHCDFCCLHGGGLFFPFRALYSSDLGSDQLRSGPLRHLVTLN